MGSGDLGVKSQVRLKVRRRDLHLHMGFIQRREGDSEVEGRTVGSAEGCGRSLLFCLISGPITVGSVVAAMTWSPRGRSMLPASLSQWTRVCHFKPFADIQLLPKTGFSGPPNFSEGRVECHFLS